MGRPTRPSTPGIELLLDVRPVEHEKGHVRLLIPKGHCLIFRGDIAHRGVEHPGGRLNHYRMHVYVRPNYWRADMTEDGEPNTTYATPAFDESIKLSSRD